MFLKDFNITHISIKNIPIHHNFQELPEISFKAAEGIMNLINKIWKASNDEFKRIGYEDRN